MVKGIYGMNIAVKNLDEAVKKFESVFGVKAEPFTEFAFPGLIGAKLNIRGFSLHLISYTSEDTSVAKFLSAKGEGVFLVSLEVDDIEKDVEELKGKGVNFVLKDIVSGGFGKVNFAHPKSMHGVQFEIYQPKKEENSQKT